MNKSKNILFISPTPTHPVNAGNRQHILTLVSELMDLNYSVHFYYVNREHHDPDRMRTFFNNQFYTFNEHFHFNLISRIRRKFLKATMGFFDFTSSRKLRKKYNQPLDHDFPCLMVDDIKKIINQNQIDTVIVEYVILSKIFHYLPKSLNKIIDTHDKFSDRFEVYLNQMLQPSWISLYPKDEIKGLNRANSIICLNDKELEFYKNNGFKRNSLLFSNISLRQDLSQEGDIFSLLYLASSNDLNIKSINAFFKDCFLRVVEIEPRIKLKIAGSICSHITFAHSNIELLGFADDLANFYRMGQIVINPELHGTGQKIKSIEALRYNKKLITTTDIGISDFQKVVFYCYDYKEMAECIINLTINSDISYNKIEELNKLRLSFDASISTLLN